MVQWHYQGFTSQQRYLAQLIQTLCPGSNQNKVHQFDRHLHLHQYLHYIKNSGNMSQFLKCNILEKVSSLLTAMTWNFLHCLNSSFPLLKFQIYLKFCSFSCINEMVFLLLPIKKYRVRNWTISSVFWNHELP